MKTKESGITLVALIITIIVLIILAAVTMLAFTESGLLQTASKGTENYANAQEYEKEIMNNIDKKAKDVVKNITDIKGEITEENPQEEEGEKGPTGKPLVTAIKKDDTRNQQVEDKNGNLIVIPAGFTVLLHGTDNVEYNHEEDHSPCVEDGIVVQDNNREPICMGTSK